MSITNKALLTSNANNAGEKASVKTESNITKTNSLNNEVSIVKTSSRYWTIINDLLTITTTITNNMDIDLEDINILDSLTEGATFVEGSVKVGSQTYPDIDPIAGATLPITLGAGGMDMEISYNISTASHIEKSAIETQGTYSFNVAGSQYSLQSNNLSIAVLNNEIMLNKQADKTAVKTGDTITYTITITNSGDLTNTELRFLDEIPEGTTFVEDSVTIDGETKTGYNPATGFDLKDLPASGSIVISFKVVAN